MISWMQRHRKYLIITIWISTIAFIGAGFMGWGQYKYGDKSSSIAKVGDITISQREMQQVYSQLFNQYNQMLKGKFDKEQAKKFGLEKQALAQLINTSYILNLAKDLQLEVSDSEVINALKTEKVFYKNGAFDKETYKSVLLQNHLAPTEYEADLKKSLLVQKTIKILEPSVEDIESDTVNAALYIADKLEYKVIDPTTFEVSDAKGEVKKYYEAHKQDFMTPVSYKIETITQSNVDQTYDDATLKEYYNEHKYNFKDADGKILAFTDAQKDVIAALNDKASKKEALRSYIAYKKDKLPSDVKKESQIVNSVTPSISPEVFKEITQLSNTSPYLKPRKIGSHYVLIKLVDVIQPQIIPFEKARKSVAAIYNAQKKKDQMLALAKKTYTNFKGMQTDFITREDVESIKKLPTQASAEFLSKLFQQSNKQGYIVLENGTIVLFNILEQKLLNKTNEQSKALVKQVKEQLLNSDLIKLLRSKYSTQMFVKGI